MRSLSSIFSMSVASSSNVPPISEPEPDIVSSSTVVVCPGCSTSLSTAAILSMATSTGCPTAAPGCMLYS